MHRGNIWGWGSEVGVGKIFGELRETLDCTNKNESFSG